MGGCAVVVDGEFGGDTCDILYGMWVSDGPGGDAGRDGGGLSCCGLIGDGVFGCVGRGRWLYTVGGDCDGGDML